MSDIVVCVFAGQLVSNSTPCLPPSLLDLKRMKDVNRSKRAQAAVKCLEFHPTANVALTAGWHKTLDLFQVCVCVHECACVYIVCMCIYLCGSGFTSDNFQSKLHKIVYTQNKCVVEVVNFHL